MKIQWMWENDGGSGYNYFDEDLNILLEFIFIRRNVDYNGSSCLHVYSPIASFTIPYKQWTWIFNFDEMTQSSQASSRKIIRLDNGKVWIWYVSGNKSKFSVISNLSKISELNSRTSRGPQAGLKEAEYLFRYDVSKNPSKIIECNLRMYVTKHTCDDSDNSVIIEQVDVNTLQSLAAARAAPQYQPQPQPQYPSQAAAAVTQQQSPLPVGWIEQRSPEGIPFYVYTSTGHTTWDRPPPPPMPSGWTEKKTVDGRLYYENSILGTTQWTRPQGGGKIGKKKKRIIKRQKTYKKRYTRRKTIKR